MVKEKRRTRELEKLAGFAASSQVALSSSGRVLSFEARTLSPLGSLGTSEDYRCETLGRDLADSDLNFKAPLKLNVSPAGAAAW